MLDKDVYYYFIDELSNNGIYLDEHTKEAFYGKLFDWIDNKTLGVLDKGLKSKNKKVQALARGAMDTASGMHDPTSKNPVYQGLRAVKQTAEDYNQGKGLATVASGIDPSGGILGYGKASLMHGAGTQALDNAAEAAGNPLWTLPARLYSRYMRDAPI